MPRTVAFWQRPASQQSDTARRRAFQVIGRNAAFSLEVGIFYAESPYQACGVARREKAHLIGGLKLEAFPR
jgi:hypothetical protein